MDLYGGPVLRRLGTQTKFQKKKEEKEKICPDGDIGAVLRVGQEARRWKGRVEPFCVIQTWWYILVN